EVAKRKPAREEGLLVARVDAERASIAHELERDLWLAGMEGLVCRLAPQLPPAVGIDALFRIGLRRQQDLPGLLVLALAQEEVSALERESPVCRSIGRQCRQLLCC